MGDTELNGTVHAGNGTEGMPILGMTKEEFDAKVQEANPAQEAPRKKKVAVLGFTESWKLAPFDDPEWEIWGLNELYMFIPRWTRWFEIHKREVYEADKNRTDNHLGKLKEMTVPIYMHQHWDDIPMSVPYPLETIIQNFGPYLTNTISYMIALAILEGFEEIGIYGVDMAHDCTSPDMRILTADLRWVRAGDLKVGQELLAFDEEPPMIGGQGQTAEFRKYRRTIITAKSDLILPSYRLTMADGKELVCSENHPWLTMGGLANQRRWLKTDKLQDRETYPSHASKVVKLMNTWEEDRSWDAGYLAAAFDGEGHISQGKRDNCSSSYMSVGFSQRLNGMSAEVERALVGIGADYSHSSGKETTLKYQLKGGRSELLKFLGSVRPRRLMDNFNPDMVGTLNAIDNVSVVKKEFLGNQHVVGLSTDTKTIIVEGYASHNTEYGTQRPSCEYFVGIAIGRGIKVIIPDQADLMKSLFLYGYQEDQQGVFFAKMKARRVELEQKLNNIEGQLAALENQKAQMIEARAQYRGAIQDCDHVMKIWAPSNSVTLGIGGPSA